jgi:O-antigen biosynthesis protein WbqP
MLMLLFSPIFGIISLMILIDDGFPIIFKQKRIGRKKKLFKIFKFRTMIRDTPNIETDLLIKSSKSYYTKTGPFLRKYSLDELPQLFNILKGDMNFIGPRPALFNQNELISLRENHKINHFSPGLTGLAQVNGRDNLSDYEKVNFEKYYKDNKSFLLDLKIIYFSIFKVLKSENVHK